jgi:sporulation protein YlmC with PRC-barrel domain
MRETVYVAKEADTHAHSLDSKKVLGKKVLSKSGRILGNITDIQIHPKTLKILGVTVRNLLSKYYFGNSYFGRITQDSIILNIDPSIFVKGKSVFTYDGKLVGKVAIVIRKGNTNDIKEIVIKSLFKKDLIIPSSAIHFVNKSVTLDKHYHGKQKYIWQKT